MTNDAAADRHLVWYKAAEPGELAEGRVKPVTCGVKTVCLTHFEGTYAALENRCPHQGEWLVNILDDLEEAVGINIEVDARVYKFDTVSFQFEKTSARAMLQMMGDSLLFEWIVRGDTLYVFKESHEILFGGEYLARRKRAWKARKKALAEAQLEAERRAREGKD